MSIPLKNMLKQRKFTIPLRWCQLTEAGFRLIASRLEVWPVAKYGKLGVHHMGQKKD